MTGIRDTRMFNPDHLKRLEPGDALYRQGDAESRVFVIASGHIKLEHLDATGKVGITEVPGPGEILAPQKLSPELDPAAVDAYRETGEWPDGAVLAKKSAVFARARKRPARPTGQAIPASGL